MPWQASSTRCAHRRSTYVRSYKSSIKLSIFSFCGSSLPGQLHGCWMDLNVQVRSSCRWQLPFAALYACICLPPAFFSAHVAPVQAITPLHIALRMTEQVALWPLRGFRLSHVPNQFFSGSGPSVGGCRWLHSTRLFSVLQLMKKEGGIRHNHMEYLSKLA